MKITRKKEKEKAWKAFSEYIRSSSAGVDGLCICYTCGKVYHLKEMDAGHWIEGHGNVVYINEAYVRPQCHSCNRYHGGNQGEFRDRIRAEIGDTETDRLIQESYGTKELSTWDYIQLKEKYQKLLHEL